MIDKFKDYAIMIGAGVIALLYFLLRRSDEKLSDVYSKEKRKKYKKEAEKISNSIAKSRVVSSNKVKRYRELRNRYLNDSNNS